jgi:hypothetical protein
MLWSKQVIRKSIRRSFLPDFPTGFAVPVLPYGVPNLQDLKPNSGNICFRFASCGQRAG